MKDNEFRVSGPRGEDGKQEMQPKSVDPEIQEVAHEEFMRDLHDRRNE
jgi:hypothetical protein